MAFATVDANEHNPAMQDLILSVKNDIQSGTALGAPQAGVLADCHAPGRLPGAAGGGVDV